MEEEERVTGIDYASYEGSKISLLKDLVLVLRALVEQAMRYSDLMPETHSVFTAALLNTSGSYLYAGHMQFEGHQFGSSVNSAFLDIRIPMKPATSDDWFAQILTRFLTAYGYKYRDGQVITRGGPIDLQ